MNKKNKLFKILIIITIIVLCIGLTPKELQNDTFYTIKVGESISKNGIDMLDHFSIHDISYNYPHWLYDLSIYRIYKLFGLNGIYISTIVLYIILIISIFYITNKIIEKSIELEYSSIITGFITIISLLILSDFATARAQLPSVILFTYEIYFIELLIKTGKKRYGIYLTLISLLVANIHSAVWPMYFIFYLPYLAENLLIWLSNSKFINYLKKKKVKFKIESYNNKIEITKNQNFKFLIIVLLISIIMGFVTPIGDMPFTYAIRIMLGNSQKYILEHQPLMLAQCIDITILITLYLSILIFTKTKIKLNDLFMLLGLLIMSFISMRHIIFISTVGTIALTRVLVNFFKEEQDKSTKQLFNVITKVPVMIIVILLISIKGYDELNKNIGKDYINEKKYPIEASKYILNNLDVGQIRLYNKYTYGSYLMYRNIPVFIDSRCDLYLNEFNKGVTVFEDEININKNYKKIFKKYNITHVIIPKKDTLNLILKENDNYKSIYKDKYFIIYERLS